VHVERNLFSSFLLCYLQAITLNPKFPLPILLTICVQAHSQSHLHWVFNKIDPQKWSASVEKKVSKLEGKLMASTIELNNNCKFHIKKNWL